MFGKKAMAVSEQSRSEPEGEVAKKAGNNADKKTAKQTGMESAVVVYGRDDKGKAHASSFSEVDKQAAIKTAHLMGFKALAVTQTVIKNIAEDLPAGRLFDSGKGFVPFVKEGVCVVLFAHAKQFPRDVRELSQKQIDELESAMNNSTDEPSSGGDNKTKVADKGDKASNHTSKSLPASDWLDVQVGTIVLAVDDPDDGWWEAKVTHAHKSGIGKNITTMLTLEWVAFPEEESLIRRSNEVAYFPTGYGQVEPTDHQAKQNSQNGGASS